MSFVTDKLLGGDDAAKASKRASRQAADAQVRAAEIEAEFGRESLDYLKEREALPRQFSEGALTQLGGLAGLEGGEGSQEELIERALASPLYQAIVGTHDEGLESVADYMAATGNLRSGNSKEAFFDYGQRLHERALLEAYDQQEGYLTGLAGLPSNANAIAQQTADIGRSLGAGTRGAGQALAQGTIGAAQARQDALGMGLNLAGSVAAAFSDSRLKSQIEKVGELFGHNLYRWVWNRTAEGLGLSGPGYGVLAEEVEAKAPEAVYENNGWKMVDYGQLGMI